MASRYWFEVRAQYEFETISDFVDSRRSWVVEQILPCGFDREESNDEAVRERNTWKTFGYQADRSDNESDYCYAVDWLSAA